MLPPHHRHPAGHRPHHLRCQGGHNTFVTLLLSLSSCHLSFLLKSPPGSVRWYLQCLLLDPRHLHPSLQAIWPGRTHPAGEVWLSLHLNTDHLLMGRPTMNMTLKPMLLLGLCVRTKFEHPAGCGPPEARPQPSGGGSLPWLLPGRTSTFFFVLFMSLECSRPQWVGMALFAQALTFYVPHYFWKTWEGKKVEDE